MSRVIPAGMILGAVALNVFAGSQTAAVTQPQPVNRIPLEERLWLVLLAPGDGDPFPEQSAEIHKACGHLENWNGNTYAAYKACFTKFLKPGRYRVATLHAAPSASSPVVATIHGERTVRGDDQPGLTWAVELVSRPGELLPWPEHSAIFDYGLHESNVQRRGDWVRLLRSIPADGWLRITPGNPPDGLFLNVYIDSLAGNIVDLEPVRAQWPNGARRLTESGTYLIQKISGGVVTFRQEIPSDFSCGNEVTDPVPLPPTLRAPVSELFNPDGTARFSDHYTKGC